MPQVIKRYTIAILLLAFGFCIHAQDIHFTNFRMAPVSVNPAFTGAFKGTYRISGIYRDQWRSIGNSSPYQTPFISAEFNIKSGVLLENDWIAGGISFVTDQAGTNSFKQSLSALNVGYHYSLDKDYTNVISVGLSYGSGSQGFNVFDLTLPLDLTGGPVENFSADNEGNIDRTFSDLSIGVTYKTQINAQGDLVRFGITGAHLTSPDISLVNAQTVVDPNNPNPIPNPNPTNRKIGFDKRITFMGEASFMTSDRIRVNPAILYQAKSSSSELAVQSTADYLLDAKKGTAVTGGLGYRLGDAFELIGGIQIKDLKVGISYDLTTSSLTNAGGGAFELSVGYIGRIFKSPNVKPVIFCPRL
jgi:type IX secretion system PorP/SprF family membrane protein